MKRKLCFIIGLILTFVMCRAQTMYRIEDNTILVKYKLDSVNTDSLKITAQLTNKSSNAIWVSKTDLFGPQIENKSLYLNISFDINRYSPMDLVPFELKKLTSQDSIVFSRVLPLEKYEDIYIAISYLTDYSYKKVLQIKKKPSNISLNDYFRFMNFLSTNINPSE
ncbi:hypothetical protein F0919_02420 [Taibaiella lutea]|uniref:Uncharacterized protein n=1 Tax=Taibaiella lutea TaxID=2608001 RepID=A0A5M6CRH1_9BACT|nr:hypothetical protein [Taibaiella lutea]KAA5536542.1 hypothetical protein F0919_02420 [Taibaiella lutea]